MSDHAGYIFAAFAVTAVVVAVMLGRILLDHRSLTRALAKLPPQRPGVVDTYVLSVSLWNEPVFENEAREAANVLARAARQEEHKVIVIPVWRRPVTWAIAAAMRPML